MRLLLFIGGISLSGCAVGPNFHRPSPALPTHFTEKDLPDRTESTSGKDGSSQHFRSGADLPGQWWALYHAPALTRLVEIAINNNPGLTAARNALRSAQEQALAQYSGLLPGVTGTFSRTRGNFPFASSGEPGLEESFGYYDAHLQLSYNFDVWGKTRRTIEQYRAAADFQKAEFEATLLTLTGNVVATAINIASLNAQIAQQEKLVTIEKKYLVTVLRQFELGGATGSDVALQRAQLAQQQAELPLMRNQLAQARHALAAYLGTMPALAQLPRLDLDALTLPSNIPVSLPSSLLKQRPDLWQAEANLHEATAGVGIAVANRLPKFTLTADLGSQAAMAGDLMTPGNGLATLATQALTPLFQGGALLHQQRAAQAQMRQRAAQWQNTLLGAVKDVANALTQLKYDAVELEADVVREQAASRALSLAQAQYQLGGVSYLTVLTSETTYQSAVIALVQARAARLSDTSALFVALGGGWWNRRDLPAAPDDALRSLLPWSRS
ncbi:efflux transporter outer membrane subunit [Acidomonas methanolica]|uniref:efflux transporter outer membrane subunit n=1 Tax=Acidomonas methanolica TaxID=437 RepID=UPI002119BE09|nr:efflux transporter outer membrane subunit [Acidomonas methanolica]MCQ9156790.1 efflux transporter outer membrane subunit [Acidomonas methanolica]